MSSYIVPAYHPAFLLRQQRMTLPTILDLKKAARVHQWGRTLVPVIERKDPVYPERMWKPKLADAIRWLVTHAVAGRAGRTSLDFEATLAGEPWCLGLWPACCRNHALTTNGICIPFRNKGGDPYWSSDDWAELWMVFRDFLESPNVPKLGQNWVGYDGGYNDRGWDESSHSLATKAFGLKVRGLEIDTMVAHAACYAELPHSLAFQSSLVTDFDAYKLDVREAAKDDEDDDDGEKGIHNVNAVDDYTLRVYCMRDAFAQAMSAFELEETMS